MKIFRVPTLPNFFQSRTLWVVHPSRFADGFDTICAQHPPALPHCINLPDKCESTPFRRAVKTGKTTSLRRRPASGNAKRIKAIPASVKPFSPARVPAPEFPAQSYVCDHDRLHPARVRCLTGVWQRTLLPSMWGKDRAQGQAQRQR
jgi:hypothetical protein